MAFTTPFTSELEEVSPREELAHCAAPNSGGGKTPCWPGATPPLDAVRAQRNAWVAPAQPIKQRNSWQGVYLACLNGLPRTQVKKARITLFSFVFTTFFTRSSAYGARSQRLVTAASAKVAAQKGANRAGATPLFRGRAAQKFRGVAPALASTSHRRFARLHARDQDFVRQDV